MAYYRETFPHSTVLPKMHILEDHVVPFMRRWGVGCGFLGEQGAESIHAYFNALERTYASIPDRLQRLKQKMVEHYLHTAPTNVDARPTIPKRRKRDEV